MKYMILFFTLAFTFSLFSADKTKSVSLNITGMTCQSCVSTVEKALKSVKGVKEAKVDLKNNKATVMFASAKVNTAVLIKAVSDAGFTANEGTAAPKTKMKKQSKTEEENCEVGCAGEDGASCPK